MIDNTEVKRKAIIRTLIVFGVLGAIGGIASFWPPIILITLVIFVLSFVVICVYNLCLMWEEDKAFKKRK